MSFTNIFKDFVRILSYFLLHFLKKSRTKILGIFLRNSQQFISKIRISADLESVLLTVSVKGNVYFSEIWWKTFINYMICICFVFMFCIQPTKVLEMFSLQLNSNVFYFHWNQTSPLVSILYFWALFADIKCSIYKFMMNAGRM